MIFNLCLSCDRRLCDFKVQDLETAISVSIQLADGGSFATSPIRLLLPQTQTLAWKAQIMSREGLNYFISMLFFFVHWPVQPEIH